MENAHSALYDVKGLARILFYLSGCKLEQILNDIELTNSTKNQCNCKKDCDGLRCSCKKSKMSCSYLCNCSSDCKNGKVTKEKVDKLSISLPTPMEL